VKFEVVTEAVPPLLSRGALPRSVATNS